MTYTLSQVTESIGTITLDHERRRNALSHALVEEVIACTRRRQSRPMERRHEGAAGGVRSGHW